MVNQKIGNEIKLAPFLKGIGQIMLQNNSLTGLFFLAGIGYGSSTMGIAAVIAVIVGTVTAKLLKYDKREINDGLYGFSATLVGVALVYFFQPIALIWIGIVIGSALATIIQRLFIARNIPAFTFPFILVTWMFLAVSNYFPTLMPLQPGLTDADANSYVALFSRGFGQVIFQSKILAGILFMIGVFMSRPIAAIYALAGIILSGMLAYQLKEPVNDIYLGLLSYNAVLCAITFAGKKPEDLIMALIGVILSVLIMVLMRYMNLPALTFPFVLAAWLTIIIRRLKQGLQPQH